MLHIGIAGVGGLGQVHLKNYLKRRDVRVCALATRTGKVNTTQTNLAEQKLALDPSLPIHTGYDKLCTDPNVDVVSINLPTDLHAPAAVRALESGKHVFCEKPMARTPAEARRMLDAAKSSGKILMIGHCLRFWPEYVAVNEIIRDGRYGRALAASFARCGGKPAWGSEDWFNNPQRSGGAVLDLHIHDIDVAAWWWGKPREIRTAGVGPNLVHSQWRYDTGLACQFEASWEQVPASPFYFNFKITLERATLLYDTRTGKGLQLATDKLETVSCPTVSAYEAEDNYFLDAVLQHTAIDRCRPEDSLVALECATETARQLMH